MANASIPYIIAEDGFYYVAYKEKVKVPEIVVSSKGVANGLSEEYNDGWDFGPDSYDPASTANPPYTETSGIQEAVNYGGNDEDVTVRVIGEIRLSVPVILPAKNITIIGSLYNINTNGANPTRGASAIVANTDFQPITYNGVSVNYLLYTQTEITNTSSELNIYGILFSGYPISVGSESSTTSNSNVNGIAINNTLAHLYIDYCKINLLNNGIVINSSGGPKYIGHTHWTYVADNAYGVICNSNSELVIDSPEFFTSKTTPNAYVYVSNASTFGVSVRISNANFTNNFACINGAIQYGNVGNVQVSNSYFDGGYILAPVYNNSDGNGPYAGSAELDNIILGNSAKTNAVINVTGSTAINTVITVHNLIMLYPPNNNYYIFYQQSTASYQSGIQLYINGFFPTKHVTTMISNITQIANVSGYNANIHLTGITNFTSSTAGTTAGTVNQDVIEYRPSYKKIMMSFSGYENDTTTDQTVDFPLAFSSYAVIVANNTGLTISASTTGITITAPDSTTTYSGIVIIEGY